MDLRLFIPAAVFWIVFSIAFGIDRSRYRNCVLLFGALFFTLGGVILNANDVQTAMILAVIVTALLCVPVFLIWNGIVMIRREGTALAHLLSLFLGIGIGFGEISTLLWAITSPNTSADGKIYALVYGLIAFSVIYFSLSFLMFMIYCVFLMIIPRRRDFDYVIILGAGLRDGLVPTKLLSDRIDKAIKVYRHDPTPPILIPSGGQGNDEKVSEAQAMKTYMVEKGISAEAIAMEDESKTTYENLINSKKIIKERGGGRYIAIVTSNYHVYRALRYGRKIGLKCTGIGAHTAFYYWPSALIREYIAIHREPKHLAILAAGWIATILFVFYIA